MIKTRKLFCLLLSVSMLISVMTTSFVVSATGSDSSIIVQGDPIKPIYTYPPVGDTLPPSILPLPSPIPPIDWIPPTIPPYSVVIPLDLNVKENVLQVGDIGFASFIDNSIEGGSWHFKIENTDIVRLDSSITVPFSNADYKLGSMVPVNGKNCTWYFKAFKQGTTSITFYQDNIYTLNGNAPAFRAICFNIRVGDPLPPTPTPTPSTEPTKPPVPGDGYLQPYQLNVLKVGAIGTVKLEENLTTSYKWSYRIDDTSVISFGSDKYIPNINPDAAIGAGGIHFWFFNALKEGETKIIFTCEPYAVPNDGTDPNVAAPNYIIATKELVYNIKVSSTGEITVKPTIPPRPTLTPYPSQTPPYVALDSSITNVLKVGSIGVVKLEYNIFTWSYDIGDRSIIDCLQIMPMMTNGEVISSIFPYRGPWQFTALKEGETTITFIGNPINSDMKMPSQMIVYNIKVSSAGDVTVKPTIPPRPTLTPYPSPTPPNYVMLDSTITNVLKVGSIGAVKLESNTVSTWSYEIGDSTIIDSLIQAMPMNNGEVNSLIYPYRGPWLFTALKEGETTITFTSNPINSNIDIASQIIVYNIKVSSAGEVTVRPSKSPWPTLTPCPTPTYPNYVVLDPAITNVLNVGSIGAVLDDLNFIYIWTYEIGDRTIIDCLQAVPMANGESDICIYPYNGPWLFTALKEGETTITFTISPINGDIKMPSRIVEYKIKVNSSSEVTVKPTDDPANTPFPRVTSVPVPTEWIDPIFPIPVEYGWAQEAVTNLAKAGIIKGYDDGTFRPGNNVTRAEFAKMLVMTFGIYDKDAVSTFSDVPAGEWYNSYVASAQTAELAKGVGDGCFSPDATITREEMFIFCARAIEKFKGYRTLEASSPEIAPQVNAFVDGDQVNDWAVGCVATVTKCGLVTGSPVKGGNAINPQAPITRAEVAVVLNRTMKLQ